MLAQSLLPLLTTSDFRVRLLAAKTQARSLEHDTSSFAGGPASAAVVVVGGCTAVSVRCFSLSQAHGTVSAVNKFKFFSLSVTLWHFPYSSTETWVSTRLLVLFETQAGHRRPGWARVRSPPQLVILPAGPALPGQPEAARLSTAHVVWQASRMQQWCQLYPGRLDRDRHGSLYVEIGPFAEINHRKFVRVHRAWSAEAMLVGRSQVFWRSRWQSERRLPDYCWKRTLVRVTDKFTIHLKYWHNICQIQYGYIQYIWYILNTDRIHPNIANTPWIYRPYNLDVFGCIRC